MAKVIWRRGALDDLDDIETYIRDFDEGAALRIAARLLALGESLSEFPRRGRPLDEQTRELVTVPPYILTYEVEDETVSIVSIRHGARMPREPDQ